MKIIKKRIVLSLEARMTSERLPNKIFKKLGNYKVIEILFKRIKKIKKIDDFFVAIPKTKRNDKLASFLKKRNINFYRGSENNVLNRVVKGGKKFNTDILVRLTGDNPFVDIYMIDKMIEIFKRKKNLDYYSNNGYAKSIKRSMPTGIDIEIIKFSTLKNISLYLKSKKFLTFPFSYIYTSKKEKFRLAHFPINKDIVKKFKKNLRLTLDTKSDLIFLQKLFKRIYLKHKLRFNLLDVVNYL